LNDLKNTTNEKKYLPLANFSFASFTTSNDLITISGKVINTENGTISIKENLSTRNQVKC
jgi:hypothetical protein